MAKGSGSTRAVGASSSSASGNSLASSLRTTITKSSDLNEVLAIRENVVSLSKSGDLGGVEAFSIEQQALQKADKLLVKNTTIDTEIGKYFYTGKKNSDGSLEFMPAKPIYTKSDAWYMTQKYLYKNLGSGKFKASKNLWGGDID